MVIHHISTTPDLFGNVRDTYQTELFEAWLLETTDGTYFISIFDKQTYNAENIEEKEINGRNLAYITMYSTLWKLTMERLPY